MARTRTLTQMISDVRQRSNLENSEFVTDAEITEYINQELAELHAHLTMGEGHPHFRTMTTFAVTVGTTLYPLPTDFWKVQRVNATVDGIMRDMEPFMEGERADLTNTQYFTALYGTSPRYRIQADNLEVLPVTRALTVTLYYIQSSTRLSAGTDTTDGFNGYEVAAIYGAVATLLAKEETDPSFYATQKDRIYQLINAQAAQRDASHPERVTDVTGALSFGREWWLP